MTLSEELQERLKSLEMSKSALAARSGVSLATVNRILSEKSGAASIGNVEAIALALGMKLTVATVVQSDDFRQRQATSKAKKLVRLVQGTSALEGQAVGQRALEKMIRQTSDELLHSKRKLWE